MPRVRIALANIPYPTSRDESVRLVVDAIAQAAEHEALVVCFPECCIPGYRWPGKAVAPPDPQFLEHAQADVSTAVRRAGVAAVVGMERVTERGLQISACVFDSEGSLLGWQDKEQLDPSEEAVYPAMGTGRAVFTVGSLTFGVVICHEGFRYPETVRWAARHGAQLVFHPHADLGLPGGYRPTSFGDPANSFHEKAMLCRAAENTCYFASVNHACEGSGTTSAVARPDGTLLCHQPYGVAGLLIADLDLDAATGLLASRLRTSPA